MKYDRLTSNMLVALLLSLTAAALHAVLSTQFYAETTMFIVATLLGGVYTLYLMAISQAKFGRVTAGVGYILGVACLLALDVALPIYILFQLLFISLLRSLYFYTRLLHALIDLILCATGVVLAAWAYLSSDSVFLSVWSFFLLQSTFVLMIESGVSSHPTSGAQQARFEQAHRNAQQAVRMLTTQF